VVQNPVQLVHRVRAKRIAYFGTVERDPHRRVADMPVIGDFGQIGESIDGALRQGVKWIVAHCYRL